MSDFFSKDENKFFKEYFKKGYHVFDVKNLDSLRYIKKGIQNLILNENNKLKKEKSDLFNNLHLHVNKKEINNFRLSIFRKLNKY